ncbi:MAG: carboxypeptidase regulatory-like domain-containing protein [Candidatus Cloacimonetes bacterium]|nr:carboxypeptidase regulatory-like domain-containing protein [Candidatus Cloacimonadota bacterium]MCK9183882.1 carboxypeptidase regulatory-like domain-containing protein [Candidatus Cloacimonadota bacterium]
MKKCLLKAILLAIFIAAAAFAWGQSLFYEEPFDLGQGWTLDSNWSITGGSLQLSWSPSITDYDLSATSPDIVVPLTAGDMVVSQYLNEYGGQGTPPETFEIIAVAGGISTVLWTYSTDVSWGADGGQDLTLSLAPFAGQTIQLKFRAHGGSTFNFNYWYIYDIKAYASLNTDLAAISLSGSSTPSINSEQPYVVTVRNTGLSTVSNYSVKLMQTGNVELGSANGTSIAPQGIIAYTIPWTPTVLGETQIWGKVVAAGDENPNNNETTPLIVSVMETGLLVAEIGTGTAVNGDTGSPAPYGTWYRAFRQQFLYRADEFYAAGAAPGLISALAFNVQSLGQCTAMTNYRIRLKHTDQTALSSSFEAGEYTTVWQRDSFMPEADWNVHSFDVPFFWNGASNLIVEIVTDVVAGDYQRNALVYYSTTPFISSSRFQSDSANGSTGTTGSTLSARSNTRFFMIIEGMGSLSGTVTASGSALSGVEISINNTIFHTVSSTTGQYSFPHVPQGAQTLVAHKVGYDERTIPFNIVEDEATTVDIVMIPSASVSVTGRIVGSDAPTLGIAGATIAFSGYQSYEATTNASGQFTIPNVYANHTYNYIITADGYAQLPGQQVVGTTPVNMGDVMVNEVAYPASGVLATEAVDGNSVTVTWNEPAAGEEAWLHYDNGDSTNNIGTGAAADFDVAIRFPGNALLDHVGTSLQAVKVWPAQAGQFSIRVWTGGTPAAPANMVVDQPFTAIPAQWNTVMLDTPVAITGNEELWFGYRCLVTGGHPAGCSSGQVVDGFSNMMFFQGEWATLTELNPDLIYNWSIRGYAGFGAPARGKKLTPIVAPARGITEGSLAASGIRSTYSHAADTDPDRSLMGYKVYRLLDDDQGNEANWTTLTTSAITPAEYVDNAWGTLPFGVYRYAVKAVYTGNVMSSPALSNIVRIQPYDMSALTISGSTTPSVGTASGYIVRVKNTGTAAQAAGAYTVKMMSGDTELVSVSGPAIAVNQELDVTLNWIPAETGTIEVYGKVVLPQDLIPSNDETGPMTVTVMEAGLLVVGIGDGTTTNTTSGAPSPYGTWYRAFREQYLFRADEFYTAGGIPGMISGVSFNVENLNTCQAMTNYTIRMKETDQTALSSTFETGEYTTVWQRPSFMPELAWNIHGFDMPFFWNGTSNVIVEIVTDQIAGSYSYNASAYYSTTDFNSSLRFQTDSASGSSGSTGTVSTNRSNIRFFMVPAGGDPLCIVSPGSHAFGDTNLGGSRSKSFTIINAGGGSLGITNISIAGSGTFALSNLPTFPAALETAETAVFTVTYTPSTLSEDTAIVTITDDQDNRHVIGGKSSLRSANSRDTHTIALSGTGVNDITIGDGGQTDRMPMDFFYRSSLFETIYSIDEMSNFVGMITGLRLYNQFSSNLTGMATKIWLGSTTQTDLAADWIPSGQLTQVFDGFVDFPSGENIITITFPEPYMHLDGGNLVMMINRPLDGGYYSSSDLFKTQTVGSNRSRNMYSDSTEYDPANPSGGSTTGIFPKTTFVVIPGGVGHITGTVLGADASPLAGVQVHVDVRAYTTVTDVQGQFTIPNVLPNDYVVTLSRHGYVTQTIDITLEEDETEVMNVTMNLMAQVDVTGTILASDTGGGIAGAIINLVGYENYSGSSLGNGSFTIPTVFAEHSYAYSISAAGYTSTSGTIDVGGTHHNMGNITLTEIAYAPNSVEAELNAAFNGVNLVWNAPDPNAVEITEGFEGTAFPPTDWSQIITNTGPINPIGVYPTWCKFGTINISGTGNVVPPEGTKQAGVWWDYNHQDEWLLTPAFNCPPDAYLSFDTYAKLGTPDGGHYYVKVSSDGGGTWTALWDASVGADGQNHYEIPVTVDLSAYAGLGLKLAFHAVDSDSDDGLWHEWFIDNIYIGNFAEIVRFAADTKTINKSSQAVREDAESHLSRANDPHKGSLNSPARSINRTLVGYRLWRLTVGQENNESSWSSLTDEMITTLNFEDEDWSTIPNNNYKWAVKAIYTAGVISAPAFSNSLVKEVLSGNIVGFVRKENNQGIAGAIVTVEGGFSATTNSAGAYIMNVPAGIYNVTAAATDFTTLTHEDITVSPNQNTTVNFVMVPVSNEDEIVPITATALRGNYPNPFNPETTISYELKESANVRLAVYNTKGQLVRSLVNADQAAGAYRLVFNGRDEMGKPLSSGIYLYRFTAGAYHSTRKMMLME